MTTRWSLLVYYCHLYHHKVVTGMTPTTLSGFISLLLFTGSTQSRLMPYKQTRKARRCNSYLQIWNYQSLTDPLTDWLSHLKKGEICPFASFLSSLPGFVSSLAMHCRVTLCCVPPHGLCVSWHEIFSWSNVWACQMIYLSVDSSHGFVFLSIYLIKCSWMRPCVWHKN